MGGLVAHIEGCDVLGIEPGILVQCSSLDGVEVDTEPFVGVADGEIESKIVVEFVVGVVELGEGGFCDVEFHFVWSDDEPEHQGGDTHDDHHRHDQFADEAEDAAAATAASAATPRAVVRFLRRRDGGAVVGAVQLSHGYD